MTRDEFSAWLNSRCGSVELVTGYYLDPHRTSKAGDTGESFCWDCVQKQRWINRHQKQPWTDIRQEDWPERDSHQFCERCEIPLEQIPTDYQLEEEIEHWSNCATSLVLSETDACLMGNLVHFRIDRDNWPDFAPLAARILEANP